MEENKTNLGAKLWGLLESVLHWFAYKLFRLNISQELWEKLMQFIQFGLVGLSNTVLCYVIFLLGLLFGLHYIVANTVGFIVSILNSYYWNNRYVFKQEEGTQRSGFMSFIKLSAVYIFTGLVLNNILLFLEVDLLHWSEVIAPIVNLLITIPLNFILNKFWAFKDK